MLKCQQYSVQKIGVGVYSKVTESTKPVLVFECGGDTTNENLRYLYEDVLPVPSALMHPGVHLDLGIECTRMHECTRIMTVYL